MSEPAEAPVAVCDSCVLYPAPLRHLLVSLSVAGLYQARWTERINEEWVGSLLRDRPGLDPVKLERTRQLMNAALEGCLVEGYEALIPRLTLPDPDDRHVLAAAVSAGAGVIVTFNLSDFPASELARYDIEAQHPDLFIRDLIEASPGEACRAIEEVRLSLVNPPKGREQYLETLEKQGLPQTVAALKAFCYGGLSQP